LEKDYWEVTEEQVIEKTGKKISNWIKILDMFKAAEKKSNEVVALLQQEYGVPRYWARTITTRYRKQKKLCVPFKISGTKARQGLVSF
jgi:hypothetical protein